MPRIYVIISLLAIASACQIEDENAPQPDDSFVKYIGELATQEAVDFEPIFNEDSSDVTGFVILGNQQLEGSSQNYYVALTDASGTLLATSPDTLGFEGDLNVDFDGDGELDVLEASESASRIAILPGFGYVIVGTSTINRPGNDGGQVSFITLGFLDENLNLLGDRLIPFTGDVRENLDLIASDILRLSDGSLLVVGSIETATGFDYYFRKFPLNQPDSVIWERTNGLPTQDDFLERAFEDENQNIVLFGYSEDRGDEGEQGTNVSFIEVNENGIIQNANSIGIDDPTPLVSNDVLTNVIEKPGGFMAVGTSTVNEQRSSFFIDIDRNGIPNRKGTINSAFFITEGENNVGLETEAFAVTSTISNDFVIAGRYPNFRTDTESRGAEVMFTRVNQIGEPIEGFESSFGIINGNDTAVDALTLPDGKIVMLATIDFGGGVQMISLIKLNDTGSIDE